MKRNYLYIILLLATAICSCYDDKGNYDYSKLNDVTIEPLETSYRVNFQDNLIINPTINTTKESNYEYSWMLTSLAFSRKCDTISHDRDLNFNVNLAPGAYTLTLRVRDLSTGIDTYTQTNLEVASNLSDGWIVLKDNGSVTDMDMFTYDAQCYTDLIKTVNGASLEGTARDICFYEYITYDKVTMFQIISSQLMVLSSKDMKSLSAFDMSINRNMEDMFYDYPLVINPQKLCYQGSYHTISLVNDGDLYSAPGTGSFTPPFQNVYLTGDKVATNLTALKWGGFYMSGYNVTTKSAVYYDSEGTENVDMMLPDMDLLDMYDTGMGGQYLLHKTAAPDSLFVYNGINIDTFPDNMKAAHGGIYSHNWVLPYVYFTSGNEVWYLNIVLKTEAKLNVDFGDEEITFMAHCNMPMGSDMDKLIFATYKNGKYKIYLYDVLSGLPDGEPQIFEGDGKVADVFHQSFYNGVNNSYPNQY